MWLCELADDANVSLCGWGNYDSGFPRSIFFAELGSRGLVLSDPGSHAGTETYHLAAPPALRINSRSMILIHSSPIRRSVSRKWVTPWMTRYSARLDASSWSGRTCR